MRIISDTKGNYISVIEEIVSNDLVGDKLTHYIGVLYKEVIVINKQSGRVWNHSEFINYYEKSSNSVWRSQSIKEKYMELYQKILNSLKKAERDRKIDEVFRDENEYQYWVC
jgi:hypothetical protein